MARKTHEEISGSKRGEDFTASRVGKVDPKEKVIVTIGLRGPELPGADEFVGQTMTPKELAERFAASQADADKVKRSLEKFGLKVEEVSLETRSMRVSGTAKAMEAAFDPKWAIMFSPTQGRYRGRKGPVKIPKELKGIVTGVFGLDQRRMAIRRSGASVFAGHKAALRKPWKPKEIEEYYNFPPGDGEGQSIAIAQFGGGYFEKDMKKYCDEVGRKTPKIRLIPAGAPAYTLEDILNIPNPELRKYKLMQSFEVMMDVEIIGSLCPKANISIYFTTDDHRGWSELLQKVYKAKPAPVALSISWGRAEDDPWWTVDAIEQINGHLNRISRKGVTTCVASGDDGWRNGVFDDKAHVDFPSCSPYVLGVGGTMLKQSGATVKEVTWWEAPKKDPEEPEGQEHGGGATGGGVSIYFDRPGWQNVRIKSLNKRSKDGRVVPDVAALAGKPYHELVFLQLPWPQGKTSASAPVWAALIARINAKLPPNKRQRFLTPLLYQKMKSGQLVGEAAFRDITEGNNAVDHLPDRGYKAGPGFDAVTGWGVPDGMKLLECLKKI